MLLDDLVSVIDTLKERMRAHGPTLRANETRTRMALIDPLLTALGWDVSDPALVTPEYDVSGKRADYALLGRDGPTVFLEAKKLDEPLSNHRSQIVAYASELGIKFPALTNGNEWEVYDNSKLVPIDQRRILNISILNTPAHECVLQLLLLWRPNLASGQPVAAAEPLFDEVPGTQPVTPAPDAQEAPAEIETHPPDPAKVHPTQSGWVSLAEFNPPGRSEPPNAVRFPDGQEHEIRHWNDILVAVAAWLNSNDRLTAANTPVPSSPRIHIVHDQPTHPTGNQFFLYREIADGQLVVNTHGSAVQMRNNARKLLRHCSVDPATIQLQVGK